MRRGEVWRARLPPPTGRRPVVLVSRDKALQIRQAVTVIQVTQKVRGLPTEVPLGPEDGMPRPCVLNADVILTISKALLESRICVLSTRKQAAMSRAVAFALGLC